jgi:Ca2+-binding RTX toxin-like protein
MELLVPLFAALMFGTAFLGRDDSGDDHPDPVSTSPTEGDDVLTVRTAEAGTFDGFGGNDTITAVASNAAELTYDGLFLSGEFYGDSQPLVVRGGAGDDDITVSGNGLRVDGGSGADIIRLNGVSNATIVGETVYGQDATGATGAGAEPDVLISISGQNGAGQFFGGSDDDFVVGGADVNGGAGADVLISQAFAAHLKGGAGDDALVGNFGQEGRSFASLNAYLATDVDTLDGGAGDDRISGSHGDIMTGGAGADTLIAYTDVAYWAARGLAQPGAVHVTDFDASEDRMFIIFDEIRGDGPGPTLAGRITTEVDADGALRIIGDGETLAVIAGGADADVAIQTGQDTDTGANIYAYLDGRPANVADADIVVQSFRGVG